MMGTTVHCCTTQLIDGEGGFNVTGLDNFIKTSNMASCDLSYAVVAIMGGQSSGKSTLLNHLFHTDFKEMDTLRTRSQTTKGIWIAKCNEIEPCTIAMDLEGTDGMERGEDDTTFEKQSALFALAVSDIIMINMWCHDIGREQAANIPLLRTVFQVMIRLFSPRKTTLLFVIRDKTKTPLEILEPILRENIQKIWDAIPKPQAHVHTTVDDFFTVEVTALSSYEDKEDEFKKEVAQLRQRFNNSIAPGGLAGDRHGVVPASAFSMSAQHIWTVIRENKDLDLPAHKVLVATLRCEVIANETCSDLRSDKVWLKLKEDVLGPVIGFGEKLISIIDTYLSLYDKETFYFDQDVRYEKRKQLESNILEIVYPAFTTRLRHLRSNALDDFKTKLGPSLDNYEGFASSVQTWTQSIMLEFDKGAADACVRQANWDASKARDKLRRDIDSHADSDAVWNQFLPSDPQFIDSIISHSPSLANIPTKKALFLALSHRPIIIDNGKKQLDRKSGKWCYMLAARSLDIAWGDDDRYWNWIAMPDSRFPEVAKLRNVWWFHIHGMINMLALSPNTQYAAYLVFKMVDAYGFQNQDYPVELSIGVEGGHSTTKIVYLDTDVDDWQHNRVVELPRPIVRSDGWLEIEIGEFFNPVLEDEKVEMNIKETSANNSMRGLFLEGIEVRPK